MAATVRSDKILAIQVLRFAAAFIVAYTHIAFGFAKHLAVQRGETFNPLTLPLSRVALFFLISGAVIVISSRRLYGTPGGWRIFLVRRLVRLLPAYWLATALLLMVRAMLGGGIDWGKVGLSALLIPYWGEHRAAHPLPVLWPAWTLFYEVLFYLAFAAALSRPRGQAVALAALLLGALVAAGYLLPVDSALAFMATRPLLALLVVGMVGGLLLANGAVLAPAWRIAAMLAAGGLMALIARVDAAIYSGNGWSNTLAIGLPALLVCLAVAGGPLRLALPGGVDRLAARPLAKAIDHLGDLSFSIFLLHLPVVTFWAWFYPKAMPDPGGWGFVITAMAATMVLAHLSYSYAERPLTGWLNARLTRPARDDLLLQQTGF